MRPLIDREAVETFGWVVGALMVLGAALWVLGAILWGLVKLGKWISTDIVTAIDTYVVTPLTPSATGLYDATIRGLNTVITKSDSPWFWIGIALVVLAFSPKQGPATAAIILAAVLLVFFYGEPNLYTALVTYLRYR